MCKVSVIIPTYNRAHCIERALLSVQNQTFQDLEILICDDGSTDSTRDIINDYRKNDSRIKLLPLLGNQGAGAARNLGMKVAIGDYIAFLDSDDEWLPDKLTCQVERMDASPPDVGVCICGAIINKNGNKYRQDVYRPKKTWEKDTFRKYVSGRFYLLTPTILFRRTCLARVGLMVPEMRRNQDCEFLLRLFHATGLTVLPDSHAIIHLIVGSRSKRQYDAISAAMPFHLQHYEMIKDALGYWCAVTYSGNRHLDLLAAAIRERRWREAWQVFMGRIAVLPILWPRDIVVMIRALANSLLR